MTGACSLKAVVLPREQLVPCFFGRLAEQILFWTILLPFFPSDSHFLFLFPIGLFSVKAFTVLLSFGVINDRLVNEIL